MKLVTSCKDCSFAVYEGKTQTGCAADRLKFFSMAECYDEELEFFVTKDSKCYMYRPQTWKIEVAPIEQEVERAKKEMGFQYTIITSVNDIEEKMKNIAAQKNRPQTIYVYSYDESLVDKKNTRADLIYVVFTAEMKDPVNRIFKRIKKSTNVFYLHKAEDIKDGFIEDINYRLIELGERKTMAVFDNSSSFIIPSILYKLHPTLTPKAIVDTYVNNMPETVWRL